jgi:hypothetical protein
VTVTDSNNCFFIDSITVYQPNELYAYFNLNYVSCYGLSDGNIDGTLIGGTPPFNYLWNTGQTNLDLFNIPSDMFIISILDSNNCFFTDTIVVFEPLELVADISFISGNLLSIGVGGTVPYTYDVFGPTGNLFASTSNNMGVSFSINPTLPGDYTLVVTDANGCIDSSIVTIIPSLISEFSYIENFNIYPNPSNDIFNISFFSETEQKGIISIYNLLGEEIFVNNILSLIGDNIISLDLKSFEKSLYLLEYKTNDLIFNRMIILN